MNFLFAFILFAFAAVFLLLGIGHWIAGIAYRDEIGEECFREARYNLGYALRAGIFGALSFYTAMVLEGTV